MLDTFKETQVKVTNKDIVPKVNPIVLIFDENWRIIIKLSP